MKRLSFVLAVLLFSASAYTQDVAPAQPGVVYGEFSSKGDAVDVNKIETVLENNKYTGKIQGKVVEVCQVMGCWAKIQKADGSTVMIKVKNHEFEMPKDIVGRVVVAEGKAEYKETSVKDLKHYAEDAGKSKEEIEKIKEPKKEITMIIKGVKVIE